MVNITVTPKLREILDSRGMTQIELAEKAGVPQGSISRFDRNQRHEQSHVFAIARALGVNVEDLFEVKQKSENP